MARARAALRKLQEAGTEGTLGSSGASRPAPLRPLAPMSLSRGRVHELTGSARHVLAATAAIAAAREGPVLWLRPGWRADTLCPQGLRGLAAGDTALLDGLIMAEAPREGDILWSMEEALRAGCVALVVAEIGPVPDLRQIRRLHMAAAEGLARNGSAKAGPGTGHKGEPAPDLAPLGLLLAQERADSRIAGIETRWALQRLPPDRTLDRASDRAPEPPTRSGNRHEIGPSWRLERRHARAAPPAEWIIGWRDLPAGNRPARTAATLDV